MLVIEGGVNTGNHPQREPSEIVILPATDGDELRFWHVISTGNICNRFAPDDHRPGFFCNIRGVKSVVRVPVSDEDVIGTMDLRVDSLGIWRDHFFERGPRRRFNLPELGLAVAPKLGDERI